MHMLRGSVSEKPKQSSQNRRDLPTYEPPNVPPYPYLYVPYPHPYTYYPDIDNQPHGGGHYGAPGEGYFEGSMPSFEGTFIVLSPGYEVGGSSRAIQDDDDDASMSE
ncbi:hypothetical protein Tco_1492621 [Tanacetum coccineum]